MNKILFKLTIPVLLLITASVLSQSDKNGYGQEEKGTGGPQDEMHYFEMWHQPYGLIIPKDKQREIYRELANMPSEQEINNNPVNQWQYLGPYGMRTVVTPDHYYSGRVLDIETDNPNTGVMVASASGGLWGYAFYLIPYCLTDDIPTAAIGSFDSKKNDWNTIIIGTGEPGIREGDGIYKTTNKGATWIKKTIYGLDPYGFYKLRYHPNFNAYPNTVFAACTYGILKSSDNGESWQYVSYGNCTDLCFVQISGVTYIFTSHWGVGLSYSSDNGQSWNWVVAPGLPRLNVGRVALASRFDNATNQSYIYANIATNDSNKTLGVFKSTNSGSTWINISPPGGDFHWGQGWYDNCISVSPVNSNIILVGGGVMRRTSDGGFTWKTNFGIPPSGDDYLHADFHAFGWSSNGSIAYTGTDGGVSSSLDAGVTWSTPINTLPITQYYGLDVDPSGMYIFGGAQDNGISGTIDGGASWKYYRGGDGGGVTINQNNPLNIFEAEGEYGVPLNFRRFSTQDGGQTWNSINGGLINENLWAPKIRSHNSSPLILYTGDSTIVYQSNNGGLDWFRLNSSGFPYPLFNLDVSPQPPPNGMVFAALQPSGSYAGNLLRVYDGGWYERSFNLPTTNYVRSVTSHPSLSNYAYLCENGFNPGYKVYKTTNRGLDWINISGNLPDVPMSYCIPHPALNNVLFAGSEYGCFKTTNGGVNWIRWNYGMPQANIITEMKYVFINGIGYIYASTYGRGMWRRSINGDDPNGNYVFLHRSSLSKALTASQNTYDTVNVHVGALPNITSIQIQIDSVFDNNDAQLQGYLIGPGGQTDTLFFNPGPVGGGGGQNFFITWLRDTGPLSIQSGTAPYTGVYRPKSPFSVFNGFNPNGNWILRIYDWGAGNSGTLQAWSMGITYSDTVTVGMQGNGQIVKEYRLYQNYPNPFNPSTTIKFELAEQALVKIIIYDITGRVVKTLVNRQFDAGSHSIDFDASNYSSGVYFYKLESGNFNEVKKMVLLK
jgi:hypothetical protein